VNLLLTILVLFLDNGSPGERLSSNATVIMNLIDENDNVPSFSKRIYYIDIPEDHPVDVDMSKPVGKVSAVDADAGDNAAIKYSIIGGNKASVFNINSETGDIFLQQSLDREVQVNNTREKSYRTQNCYYTLQLIKSDNLPHNQIEPFT
jgi:hypothetical protein